MNHHGKQINHVLILRRRKDKDSTDTMCCVTDGDPWSAKKQHWKSEAKEVLIPKFFCGGWERGSKVAIKVKMSFI